MRTATKIERCNIIGGIVYYLKKMLLTLHLDSHSITDSIPEMLLAVLTGNIEFDVMEKMYVCREDYFFLGKND